jgi:hypothetical protein
MTDQPTGNDASDAVETATANLATIMRLAPDSAYGDLVTHETRRRHKLYELLADSDDPMWKEIGTQLRDGQMQLHEIFRIEAYASHLTDTVDKHARDFPEMLAETREHLEAEDDGQAHGPARR